MQDFFTFFLVFSLYFASMKKILLFWSFFFLFFFGIVWVGFFMRISHPIIIGLLLGLYFSFQIFSFLQWWISDRKWWSSSIIVQLLFAIVSPLYYSNFWDPVSEFIRGQWFESSDAFEPCQLCWWARILMFPLLPLMVLYIASLSRPILWYIYAASGLGILLETFHYLLQKTSIPNPFGCTTANPCSALGIEYFDFMTIPFLCLIAFLVIHIFVSFLLFSKKLEKNGK